MDLAIHTNAVSRAMNNAFRSGCMRCRLAYYLFGIESPVNYDLGHKPTKSQVFAQKICYIAVSEWGFLIEVMSPSALEHLADEALRRFPEACDAEFRQMAIGRVRVFQRRCGGAK